MKKKINKYKTSKKHKTLRGGKFVGEGTYGCVISPAIPCMNIKSNTKKSSNSLSKNSKGKIIDKTVSKIIISPTNEIKEEIELSHIIHKIDPQQKHFITFNNTCVLKKLPNNRTNTVKVHHYDDSQKNYKVIEKRRGLDKKFCPIDLDMKPINLIMPYAGYDLIELVKNKSTDPLRLLILKNLPKDFKDCFKNLLIGIYKLHQNRIVNRDIKEENITANYNEKTKKVEMRFIDFGLSDYLSAKYCSNYKNITYKGTPDFIPPEIVASLLTYNFYNINKDINYIFQKVQNYYKETDAKPIFVSIKESNMFKELNYTLINLIKGIYNDLKNKTFLPKYFGSQENKFNGYLQKADVYALGMAMYEFLEVFTDFINVKKDIKLHNLLINMIQFHPDKRYNVTDCLNHPYFK
jgi:serine/threonine protein kinase